MKILKILLLLGVILFTTETFGQKLPDTYQTMFNEIITNFKTIESGNTIKEGKNTLSVVDEKKIVFRITHDKKVKNLTFVKKANEDNNLQWIAANEITISMVNKYEDFLTEVVVSMYELSIKKSKE